MLLGAHLIVGAVAGEYVNNPFLAFAAGIILHFILDAIPHYDTTDEGKITKRQMVLIAIDGIISLVILYYCFSNLSTHQLSFVTGSFGGILPDILDNVFWWQKKFRSTKFGKAFNKLHGWLQKYKLSPIAGLSAQYLIIALAVLILININYN